MRIYEWVLELRIWGHILFLMTLAKISGYTPYVDAKTAVAQEFDADNLRVESIANVLHPSDLERNTYRRHTEVNRMCPSFSR
jgi:hypothetical protein